MKKLLFTLALLPVIFTANAQSCPDDKHPHLIDLGLPSGTKWACCNVGADKPEEYGGYYAWGETKEKEEYRNENYHGGSFIDVAIVNSIERRNEKLTEAISIDYERWQARQEGTTVPDRKAKEIVQIDWKMPTLDQVKELIQNCKYQRTTINGVKGASFTGPNGRSIFLPAAGEHLWDILNDAGWLYDA